MLPNSVKCARLKGPSAVEQETPPYSSRASGFRPILCAKPPHCPEAHCPFGVRANLGLPSFGDRIMPNNSPSALIADNGRRVLLRLQGWFYERSQPEFRAFLVLPAGSPGLGISIDSTHLRLEFTAAH